MFIDVDAHVDECQETWSYFPKSVADLRPAEMIFPPGGQPGYLRDQQTHGWFIDGLIYHRNKRNDQITGTTVDARELYDPTARVADLDRLGIKTQVLYPTLLLYEITRRPELDVAICESYNRWIGDRCADSGGRLRWVATLPYRSVPAALSEMRRAKKAGAVGIFKRGFECDERRANDAYFNPIYELAQELDLPVCLHSSRPYVGLSNGLTRTQLGLFGPAFIQDAFLALLMANTSARFPDLRFGFVEAGAGWVPYMLWLSHFDPHLVTDRPGSEEFVSSRDRFERLLDDRRIFVTCEASENLPVLIDQVGDSAFCVGSDYGHADRAAVLGAHKQVVDRDDLERSSVEKITTGNGARLYGFA